MNRCTLKHILYSAVKWQPVISICVGNLHKFRIAMERVVVNDWA